MRYTLDILFHNDSILAMEKPTGLLSVPDRFNDQKPSLATLVLERFPTARPLHRLDFETSGIMLFCLLPEAFGWYSDQFEQRLITKKYLSISEGRSLQSEGFIDAPLFTQTIGKVLISKKGKLSQTRWNLLEGFLHHSYIEANPLTGRTHQIRVHLASIGLPIVGDKVYGSGKPLFLSTLKGKKKYKLSKAFEEERPLVQRMALHASALTFQDYTTGTEIVIESALPKDLQVAINKLRQYAPVNK